MNLYCQCVLFQCWTEPHRYYHSLSNHLFPLLYQINAEVQDPRERRLLSDMAWWHDAVCEPGAKDNEERSVELMRSCYDPDYMVDRAILATKAHLPTGEPLIDYFLTLDLGPLRSFDKEALLKNEGLLRQEYQRYDEAEYAKGRIDFLKRMLTHPLISDPSGVAWMIEYIRNKYERAVETDIEARR